MFLVSQGLPCPPNYNPGDFYIHSLATVPGQENESRKRVREICNAFEACDMGRNISRMAAENQKVAGINQDFNGRLAYKKGSPYKASWWTQFTAVLWRSCLSVLREPQVNKVKAFQTLVINCTVIASVFIDLNRFTLFSVVHFSSHSAHLPRADLHPEEYLQHPGRTFRLSHQYDIPECFWSCQCELLLGISFDLSSR